MFLVLPCHNIPGSRKLVSQLSKRYFRHRMKTFSNIKARCKNENGSDISDCINKSYQDGNTVFYNTEQNNEENSEDDSKFNFDNNNINVCDVRNYVANNINIGEVENIELEDDFTPTHLARWCTTFNVMC